MEQKFAKIDEALQNAGCSSAEYIRYCLEQQNISLAELYLLADKFAFEASDKHCEAPEGVRPGMFVYADGLIASTFIPNRQVCAIVGYVDGNIACAVCLKEKLLQWSSDCLTGMPIEKTADGREETRRIISAARRENQLAEAAQWCYNYVKDGIKQGEAYLPSLYELGEIYKNKSEISAALSMLSHTSLYGFYWSSAEQDVFNAWCVSMYNGEKMSYAKSSLCGRYVRPCIRIKF